jgi:hypothetical protein
MEDTTVQQSTSNANEENLCGVIEHESYSTRADMF